MLFHVYVRHEAVSAEIPLLYDVNNLLNRRKCRAGIKCEDAKVRIRQRVKCEIKCEFFSHFILASKAVYKMRIKMRNHSITVAVFVAADIIPVSYTHLTLPTNREV